MAQWLVLSQPRGFGKLRSHKSHGVAKKKEGWVMYPQSHVWLGEIFEGKTSGSREVCSGD